MEAVVFQSPSVLSFTAYFAFSRQPKLGKPIFSRKEIADGALPSNYQKDRLQLTVSSVRDDGNRRGRPPKKSSASDRATDDDNDMLQSSASNSNPSNQEEIISIFRRIQSSISKEKTTSTKKKSPTSFEDRPSSESVLEVLRQSSNQMKGKTSNKGRNRRREPKNEQEVQINPPASDFKLTRPPSNFVKRSPIPSLSKARGQVLELNTKALPVTIDEFPVLNKLKLHELKELAKSRGLKGYSKLKKSELVKLLS